MQRESGDVISLGFGTAELLDGIGAPVLITSPDRIALWANEPFADLFGIEDGAPSIIGQDLRPLAVRVSVHYRDPQAFLDGIARAIDAQAPMAVDVLERRDGRFVSRSFSPVKVDGEVVAFVWRYDDVTEIHRRTVALERSSSVLQAMVRAHGPLVRESSSREVFSELLGGLIDVTESAYGFIGEVHSDSQGPFLRSWAISDIAWDHATREFFHAAMRDHGFLEFRRHDSLYGATLLTGEVVISNDPSHDSRAGGLPSGHPPLGAYLGLPILRNGVMIGMAGLAGRVGGYDSEMVERVQPLLSACGSMIEACSIDRERRAAETAMRNALVAAEHANASKTRLLGRVSHELRTPLNAVLGFAQLLGRSVDDERAARWVAQIEQAGHHVLGQVEDLLDLAAAETGSLGVDVGPIEVDALVGSVLDLVSPIAVEQRVVMSHERSGLWVEGDVDRLRVVLLNLVSNAIKYNRPGGTVHVSASAAGGRVHLSVSDDGPGIPEHQMEEAFALFERLDAAGRGVPGAGLGLAIAREFTRAMRGELRGRVRESGGVEMIVSLAQSERGGTAVVDEPLRPWVLYVEDNAMNAELVTDFLTSFEEVPVEVAPTLADARRILAARAPSLVLLDLNLPDGFGGDLAAELLQRSPDIPVVLVTADLFAAQDLEATMPALAGTLVKPLRLDDLSSVVKAHVQP